MVLEWQRMAGGARTPARRRVLVCQASREGLFLRLASALLVVTCLAVAPLSASSQEQAHEQQVAEASQDPWATFAYLKPAPVYRLRLGLEETAMIAAAVTGYLIKAPEPSDPNVPSFSLWEKLRFAPGSWYLDVDELATNFVGHPTAGTFYYMFARSNRVSIPEAFAWTVATSTVWEFLEYKEPVSINDMVVTPVAGLAIGEAFTQLSGWFDRSGTNGLSKALAWIFDPMRKFHDWIDKAQPLRDPAYAGWHEFRAGAAGVLLWQEGQFYPALEVELASRLFRVPGYGQAGRAGFGFIDGNVSAIGLTSTFASGRAVDFLFDTETALVGHYSRDLWTDGEELHGWDLFVGGTVGFEFGSHVWDIAGSGPKNQIAMVRFPGIDGRVRLFAGEFRVDCSLDVAFDFGGVEPIGAPGPGSLPPGQVYPSVYNFQGYYYAVGLHAAPALEVRYGGVGLGASLRSDLLWGLTGPFVPQPDGQVISLTDTRTSARAWLRYRVPDPSLEFAVGGIYRDRRGTAGAVEANYQERSLFGSFAVVF
jgi:hypothetical protein